MKNKQIYSQELNKDFNNSNLLKITIDEIMQKEFGRIATCEGWTS